ncbi:MAG: WYL domain-containing protein [Burkholderiales bacterium]|nr:WYL domain-containing protein [Burkholderiales bacterium]OJX05245.1 MAG: transcriptional regulator [Burkholderiales bacterium 70-64]
MHRTERLYRIDQLIHQHTVIAFNALMRELEVSRATLKRDIAYMRDRLNAPIVHDRERGGYCFAPSSLGPQYGLPGLWFNDREVLALLTMHRMLEELDTGGLLGPHIQPLVARLNALLGTANDSADEIMRRVHIIAAQSRPVKPNCFEIIGSALVARRRLEIAYFTRSRNTRGVREVSPQRLVWYRSAWYLDAWCHRTGTLRVFALDAVEQTRLVDRRAHEMPLAEVERRLGSGYGIFRGRRLAWATLRFSADAARWVRAEVWHPEQEGRELADGGWELRVPYGATPELEMDILRHGEHVEVVGPPALRRRVAERLTAAQAAYR